MSDDALAQFRAQLQKERTEANAAPKHVKARGFNENRIKVPYPHNGPFRSDVPDEFVSFAIPFPTYAPIDFLAPHVQRQPTWADPIDPSSLKFNTIDFRVDRTSFTGAYIVGIDGRPKNPMGRTGMTNRGCLGRWGPNHAADPIVTRMDPQTNQLQFVAIYRQDGGGWAIPGGIVDAGEQVSETLKREFGEEALSPLNLPQYECKQMAQQLEEVFKNGGVEIFRGYVDDPRNTDNAWMETVAVNFHLPDPLAAKLQLNAGSDATRAQWMSITRDLKLYASHAEFIKKVAANHNVSI